LIDEAIALERAGCFSIVLEAIPSLVAARITEAVKIPTIGIGAGVDCSGQVLVWHDLLGLSEGPTPRFVKMYASLATTIRSAIETYASEVRSGAYPSVEHTYGMPDAEREQLEKTSLHNNPRS
jgi:3-methyl-2-oxobutanoate hydroxymethyltransferase